jgi:putative peptidoglycan lipid II flippase
MLRHIGWKSPSSPSVQIQSTLEVTAARTGTESLTPWPQHRANSVPVTLMVLFGVTLLSKALGFLSQILVTSLLGTTGRADTYQFAFSLVNIVSALVVGSAGFAFIPLYIEKREHQGTARANQFANAVLTYLTLALAFLSLLMVVSAGPLVIALGRFPAGLQPLAIRVFAVTAPLAVLTGMGQLLMALSQARKRFVAPAFMGVLHSVVFMTVVAVAWKRLGVYSLVLGVTISTLVQAVVMMWRLASDGRLCPSLRMPRTEMRHTVLLTWPLVLSQFLSTIQVMTSRNIASGLVVGSVAALVYAESLKAVFLDLCVVPVAQVSLPLFAERLVRGETDSAWEQLQGALAALWFLVTPVVVTLSVLSGPLVRLFYQRGAFTAQSTALTASALAFFGLGLLGESAHYLVSRYFLGLKDTRTLTLLGLPLTILYVVLLFLLSRVLSLEGIALGHSLVMIAHMATGLLLLRNKLNQRFTRTFRRGLAKITVCGLAMWITTRSTFALLGTGRQDDFLSCIVVVSISGLVGVGIYLAASLWTGIAADIPLLRRLHPRRLLAEMAART